MMSLSEFFYELKKEIKKNKVLKTEDINKICNSSISYDEKIRLLNEFKVYSDEIYKLSNVAQSYLESGYYLNSMKFTKIKLRNNLIWQLPLSLGFTTFNGYNIYEFINYVIENQNVLELQSQDLLKLLVTILILPILSGVIDVKTIKNYINYSKYDNEINTYNLRLKDKIHY